MIIRHIVLVGVGLAAWPASEARAEFWTALDTEPKPNVVIAIDASVTMGIEPNACGGNDVCHNNDDFDPTHPRTRLNVAKRDLLATIPSFRDYFAFGGFRYQGCGRARTMAHVMPDNRNLTASYDATETMIDNAGHCDESERRYPNGASPSAGCVTPTPNCQGDQAALSNLINGGIAGINVPQPAAYNVDVTCDLPSAPLPFINLRSLLLNRIGSTSFNWPSWGLTPDPSTVRADLCDPLDNELTQIQTDIQTCTSTPTDIWDMGFLTSNWCDATTVANTICQPTSPWYGSCICNPSLPGCHSAPIPRSDCNIMLTWKARQQVAVCETYSPLTFGDWFKTHPSQSDNIARGPGPNYCRENVALFLTDGAFGDTPGVIAEAFAAQEYYRSADMLSNMFVFHISNSFVGAADTMMNEVSGHREPAAFDAQDTDTMQESFSKVLSRVYKGVYTGASLTLDQLERRAVFHSFTVPGYDTSGAVGVSDDYLAMPSRISVHEVRPDGVIEADPLYESDLRSVVAAGTGGCGPIYEPTSLMTDVAYPGSPPVLHVDLLGPGGEFRNGVDREVHIPANVTDRDGDHNPDTHDPLTYGYSYGLGQSTPLIVDAPKDVPTGGGTGPAAANHMSNTRTRPRVIYYQANGYVIGLHGGDYDPNPGFFGDRAYLYSYDDSVGYAGSEVFRYRPGWLEDPNTRYTYRFNDVVQQPLMTGELIAKELFINGQYYSVLLGNQGKEGVGYFAVDISDPCTPPAFVAEWTLPAGSYASGEPIVYDFPMLTPPLRRPALLTTSGLDASNDEIYAYDVSNGNLIAQAALPAQADHSYPNAPVCVDATGEGTITHCYALRSDGFIARVEVAPRAFGSVDDVTPVDASGNTITQAAGRTFYAQPVAFFDQDGAVSLVFGSGDYQNLTQPSGQNYVYKVRDANTRRSGVPAGPTTVAQVCLPDGAGNTDGIFRLRPRERLISKPIVEGGLVAWTTYVSGTNACTSGDGYLYVMDYQTCADVVSNNARPQRIPIGPGLPTSPSLHLQSQRLLINTSAGPTAAQVAPVAATTRGGGRPVTKRLYWRLEMDSR